MQGQSTGALRNVVPSDQYRFLFQSARDIILFVRRDGRILDANPAAVAAYGYARQELRSMSINELRAAEVVFSIPDQMGKADLESSLFETVHLRKDGSAFPVEVSAHGADLRGQRVLVSIIRDISDRKQAEAERERLLEDVQRRAAELAATIKSITDGVIVCSYRGDVLSINPAAQRMMGFPAGQEGQSLEELLDQLEVETLDGSPVSASEMPILKAIAGEPVQGVLIVVRSPGGMPRWVSASASPIRSASGNLLGAVATFTDVSLLHELQEQRARHVLGISHGLRTPLTVIHGHAQLLHRAMENAGLSTGRSTRDGGHPGRLPADEPAAA